ncbi:MAG: flagellin [Myxococcota bacterium]|jgi:flagellin|nr:flagellin [Myxococcota bacterium]
MKISTHSPGQRYLQRQNQGIGRSLERLASGSRIPRASADAAGLAISESLRAESASLSQGVRNLNDGISAARVAEGALDESSNILGRLRELSIQSRNGTLNGQQRQAIQREFDSLSEQLSDISQNSDFNGKKLLDGSDTVAVVDGTDGEATELAVDDQSAAALGVEGLDASDPASLDRIDQAISQVSSARAELGATENRLSSQVRSHMIAIENTQAANSRIRDTDFAKETSNLMSKRILQDAGVAVRAQANATARSMLQLLKGL